MASTSETALGMVETRGLVAAIEAADAMSKAAEVRLVAIEQTTPALMTAHIVGEVAAVTSAVEAGRRAAERVGEVVSAHVIPRPDDAVHAMQALGAEPSEEQADGEAEEDLASLTVPELRALARAIPDLPMQGREISKARKQELIDVLKEHR